MAKAFDPYRFSSPRLFLISMIVFLIITGFLISILYSSIAGAFATNPGLNGLILFVLMVGTLLALAQVVRLMPEVDWVNNFRRGGNEADVKREPVLLAPMKALLGSGGADMSITTNSMRSILDSIGNRLDDLRDISRYLIGLLVFLGLLGTFWGLLKTIGSIGDTIQSLDAGSGDTSDILDALKAGLKAPLDGMGTAFSSSLFGLAGSLILGFLDLQAGRAQTRFYTELENWLSSVTDTEQEFAGGAGVSGEIMDKFSKTVEQGGGNPRATAAMASLAESIQGMVQHMRADQKALQQKLDAQEKQNKELSVTLKKLSDFFDKAAKG
ncbi:MAG: MotA/TolQ/ExbB proton channel family protein [Nitratireductor sp.]